MNNIDLSIEKIRVLQEMFFDPKQSPNDFFTYTNDILLPLLYKASKEINTNYEEISEKLTKQLNTGRKQ